MDEAKKWRVYYKIQELLSIEFGELYGESEAIGGIRNQSTLPKELNDEARRITEYISNVHQAMEKVERKFVIVKTNEESYHTYLDDLPDWKRAFVDQHVISDHYFLAMYMDTETIIGGFVIKNDGNIGGLFALEKGIGSKLLNAQLKIAKGLGLKEVTLTCIGDFLLRFYEKVGFYPIIITRWDERLAPQKWDSKFGFPYIYTMRKVL